MPGVLDVVPGAQAALTWLGNKMGEYEATGPKLNQQLRVAGELAKVAADQGNTTAYDQLVQQITRLGNLAAEWQATRNKLAPVRDWLRANGFAFPVIPIIVAAAAVAAITSVAYVIQQSSLEQSQLDLVAQGLLSPQEYARMQDSTGKRPLFNFDFGALVPVLAVAGIGYLGFQWLKGQGHGSQRWD